MFNLYDKLDDVLILDDETYALDLSFDNVLRMFKMFGSEDVHPFVKYHEGLFYLTNHVFVDLTVEEAKEVFEAIFDEHINVRKQGNDDVYDLQGNLLPVQKKEEKKAVPYDLEHDAEYIYASFMQAYGIDLIEQQGKLHWKKFNALLSGLHSKTKFMEVIRIRTWEPQKGDSPKYRQEMKKLQREYALPEKID